MKRIIDFVVVLFWCIVFGFADAMDAYEERNTYITKNW